MSEMIERVESAILAAMQAQGDGQYVSTVHGKGSTQIDGYFDLAAVARAAIEAMREPTEAMVSAGGMTSHFNSAPEEAWDAMIDEALGPREG